ncbi:hypothetical protein Tco_0390145, partial [Tanacetum coccineum]
FDLKGYLDSDYAGCKMDRKSTSCACQVARSQNVYWSAKEQQSVAMSSAKAEYAAAAEYHILKEDIELHFIPTQYQLADIFTKPLDEPTFKRLIVELDQVEFTFDEITFTTNNEVALLYLSHLKSEYFHVVFDFISKCCLREAFTKALNQYKEYLFEFWYTIKTLKDSKIWVSSPTRGIRGKIGITTFRNALRAHYLPHSRHDQISNKDAIILYCLANGVEVDFSRLIWEDIIHKLNKKTREKVVPYLSQSSASTLVVDEMHKEEQQAVGGPPSFRGTRCDASADSTAEVDPGISAPNDSIPQQ